MDAYSAISLLLLEVANSNQNATVVLQSVALKEPLESLKVLENLPSPLNWCLLSQGSEVWFVANYFQTKNCIVGCAEKFTVHYGLCKKSTSPKN